MSPRSTFSQEIADLICNRMANGESLRAICRDEGMPAASTVCLWAANDKTFAEQYARARDALGRWWPITEAVVLQHKSVEKASAEMRLNVQRGIERALELRST
jgi:hypothetical protein